MAYRRIISGLTILALTVGTGLALVGATSSAQAASGSNLQLSISPLECTVDTVQAAQQQGASIAEAFGPDCQALLDKLAQTFTDTDSKGEVVTYAIERPDSDEQSTSEEPTKPESSIQEPSERHIIYTIIDNGQQPTDTALPPQEQKNNEAVLVAVTVGSVVLVSIILLLCFILLL